VTIVYLRGCPNSASVPGVGKRIDNGYDGPRVLEHVTLTKLDHTGIGNTLLSIRASDHPISPNTSISTRTGNVIVPTALTITHAGLIGSPYFCRAPPKLNTGGKFAADCPATQRSTLDKSHLMYAGIIPFTARGNGCRSVADFVQVTTSSSRAGMLTSLTSTEVIGSRTTATDPSRAHVDGQWAALASRRSQPSRPTPSDFSWFASSYSSLGFSYPRGRLRREMRNYLSSPAQRNAISRQGSLLIDDKSFLVISPERERQSNTFPPDHRGGR